MWRHATRVVAAIAALSWCGGNPQADLPEASIIVHVLVDDLGWADADLSTRPSPDLRTPSIEALRDSAIEMRDYYAWKQCGPSRAMTLTGRYYWRLGMSRGGGAPPLHFPFLPSFLKRCK